MIFRLQIILAVLALFLAACDSGDDLPLQEPDYVQEIAFDIPSAAIGGNFTLNAGQFPASFYQRGAIFLMDQQTSAYTLLGETWEGSYPALRVIRQTYDVGYGRIDGVLVPQNSVATAMTGALVDADMTLDVDVPRVIVVPSFTLDGGAFPGSVYNSAEFFLRPTGSDELISLGTTNVQPAENVMVVPGTYDVIYSIREGELLPQNEFAVVTGGAVITTTPHVLNVDIETVAFNGSWRLAVDGVLGDFPSSVYQRGEMFLRTDSGDSVPLGPTHMSAGTVPVIAGTYDVVYSHIQGDLIPQNMNKMITKGLVLPPGRVFIEDVIDAWTAVPEFRLDGSAFPASAYESGEILALDPDTGGRTSLGRTHLPPAPVILVEGTYDAAYRYVDGATIPQNDDAVVATGLLVDEPDEPLLVDVDAVSLTGEFSLNGEPFPSSAYHTADILLYRDGDGTAILLGKTHVDPEPVVVVAGTYDVVYQHIDGDLVPQNAHHKVFDGDDFSQQDAKVTISILPRHVRPAFTLDGLPFPAPQSEHADFYLHGNHPDDWVRIGASAEPAEESMVIRGSYDVEYFHVQGEQIPNNTRAVVGQVLVD